ncbi:unnamed protein product [Closterium sp. NIES-54]
MALDKIVRWETEPLLFFPENHARSHVSHGPVLGPNVFRTALEKHPLPARVPPLQPVSRSCSPLAARVRPARRPCSPLAARLRPARRPLQPARCPLAARSPPLAALLAGALLPGPPCCCPPCSLPCPARFPSARALPSLRTALLVARHTTLPSRASLSVLTFDHEGHPIQFNTWLDDLQLYQLSDYRDNFSLFDHTSGASLVPPATADNATRSQWLTRDAAACLAVRNHPPLAKRTHFGQDKTAKALYDAVVTRYSSPTTTALGRLIVPCLFPELSAFTTVEDLVAPLRTSDARYRAALPADFLNKNPPPMYITLYFIVTCLRDSLRAIRDHCLALDPTDLTNDLLKKHLLATKTSVVSLGAARGTNRTPFSEGCSPSPLAPSYASAAAVDIHGAEDVRAASTLNGKHRRSKGKGGKGGGGGSGGGGGGGSGGGGGGGGGVSGGSGGGTGGLSGGGGGSGGSGGSGSGGTGGGRTGAQRGGSGGGQRQQQQRRSETPSPQQLREWFAQRGASGELLRSGVDIFALDFDAILVAMYALSVSAEGDCYRCVPPDQGIEAAALGASESDLPGTVLAEALHSFTLDSGASRCFFRDSTTLTPLSAPVPVRLADPSGGPVLARSSTVLPCSAVSSGSLSGLHLPSFSTNLVSTAALQDAMVTTTTPQGQRVSICTCIRTGSHLATFTHRPGSSLYKLTTEPPQVAASAHVSASGPVEPPCSCRLLTHQTLLRHHQLGHPSLPRLRCMHSRLLVSDLPRSLPPLPPSPAPPCLPCVEGQQRAAPHSSLFPPTTTPLQTLHMDSVSSFASGSVRTFLSYVCTLTEVGPTPSGVSQVDPLLGTVPVEVAIDSGAARVAGSGGAASGGAKRASAEPRGTASAGGPLGALPRLSPRREPLSPQQLREWFAQRTRLRSGAAGAGGSAVGDTGAGGAGAVSLGGAGVTARAGGTRGAGAAGPVGARTRGIGAAGAGGVGGAGARDPGVGDPGAGGTGAGGAGAGGAGTGDAGAGGAEAGGTDGGGAQTGGIGAGDSGAGDTGAGGAGAGGAGAGDPRAGGTGARGAGFEGTGVGGTGAGDPGARVVGAGGAGAGGTGAGGTILLCPPPHQSQPQLQPGSPVPASSPYAKQTDSLTERHDPESCLASPVRAVCTGRRVPRLRPPPFPGTHSMTLCPSSIPLRSTDASALDAEFVDFAVACCLVYAASLVAEFESDCPPSVRVECALGTDVFEDRQEDFECLAAATNMDAEMASWKSTGTYVDAVPPSGANIIDGMWILRVKWASGSPSAFKARYVVRGFSQRQGVDFSHTFSPTPKMTTLRVLLHVAAQRDYKLHSLDFNTIFLQGSLHEEIWLRRPPGFTGSFPIGTQWSLWRPVYGLRQAPRKWHDTLRTSLGFAPSTADPSLFLRTVTSLPPLYILVYVNDLVFATADTQALTLLKLELRKRHTCTDLGELRSYLGLQITRDRARRTITLTQSHMVHQVLQRFGFWYSSPQSTPLPTGNSLSAPPSDESVQPSGPYPELVGWLMYLMTCTRPVLAYPLSILARYVASGTLGMGLVLGGRGLVVLTGHTDASWADDLATQRSSQGYTFNLGFVSVSWRSTRSSSVLSSSCEAEIYAGAMAAQELRWLICLLTDLGERPRSSPVLYVDNKAMIALCQEHRLEHRTKHIALRYFLARELQQRGQLRLAYVGTRANTAVIFTKALQSGDHQRFCIVLGLVPTLPHLLTA